MKRQRRTPPEPTWRSGPSFPLGADVTGRYKTVTDFEIAVVQSGATGSHMEWRSATLGLLTPFDSYHRLERPEVHFLGAADRVMRLEDGWRPVGTVERPYIDLDHGFVLVAWADDRFVYVEHGDDIPLPTIRTWYRVPVSTFDAAWADMLERLANGSERGTLTDTGR